MVASSVLLLIFLNISFNMADDKETEKNTFLKILREDLKKDEELEIRAGDHPSPTYSIDHDNGHDAIEQRLLKVIRDKGITFLMGLLNKLQFEFHLPGYEFCGPGTKSYLRLSKGERGINQLDAACREHDITYYNNDESIRAEADLKLATRAHEIYLSPKISISERFYAFKVAKVMAAKYNAFTKHNTSH